MCLHDVCHFALLTQDERRDGRKSWFLTRDKTLIRAAGDLGGGQLPFCFLFAGFLQSISPFLEAPDAQHSLVELFSAVLEGEIGDQNVSGESLFNLSELKNYFRISYRCAKMGVSPWIDSGTEHLVPAFDYVKNNILRREGISTG